MLSDLLLPELVVSLPITIIIVPISIRSKWIWIPVPLPLLTISSIILLKFGTTVFANANAYTN